MENLQVEMRGDRAELLRDFSVRVNRRIAGFGIDRIKVPQGFVTDFASVPKRLWSIVPPIGKFNRAAVVHDWLYSKNLYSRKAADKVFLELMRRLGVRWSRRWVMYLAVRAAGWVPWKKYASLIKARNKASK